MISNFSISHGLVGGILIGLSSLLAAAATGKIPGISGILGRIWQRKPGDTLWRSLFIIGLIIGAGLTFTLSETAATYQPAQPTLITGIAGLLVGLGTRLGGGCTSGHGICGIGLGARDSLIATLTFMTAGILTVYLLKHLAA